MRALLSGLAATALLCLAGALPASAQQSVPWAEPTPLSVEEAVDYYRTYRRALEFYAEDRFEESIPLLEELVERQPGDAEMWFRLGRAVELAGHGEAAIEGYRQALDIGYRFGHWISHRIALLHTEAGRTDSVFVWLERALAERWDDRPSIGSEPAFEALRGDPRFPELAGELPDREFTRDEGWRCDLDFLVREARRMHVGQDRPAYSQAFDSAAASLRERIPELSNDRIVVELRRLLILLGDGHSGIYGPGPDSPPPLYLRHVDREYWLEPLPEHDALYFQFNQVRNAEEGPSLAAFADTLRSALERTEADHLIVDVRHNNGGNNGLLRLLVRTMIWWEQATPGNGILVLAGRNTFSATQNFVNRVERWTDAVFAGEPASSRPNFSGEETNVVLPFSRVRATISTLYWQDSDPDDRRPWIPPRIPVTLSSDDYFANRDPVLEAVLQVANGGTR